MAVRGYGTPATYSTVSPRDDGGGAPKSMLRKTVWKYIDFMKLYRGISDADYREFHTAWENSDGGMIQQSVIDLNQEVAREAKARGMKPKDVVAEFEAKAVALGLPSATGVAPPRVSGFGSDGGGGVDGRVLVGLSLLALLAGRELASRYSG
jgi:hypothetical protein